MITNPAISAVLATGHAMVFDLVTLTINRGRCWQFDANGLNPVRKDILDSVRWTSAPRALRANVADGLQVFQPLSNVAYQRDTLGSKAGAEVLQVGISVTGVLPVYLSTAQDGSGSFATTLAELTLLGLLEGATLSIDQVVCSDLPATPVSAGAAYGIVSPDPIRIFSGIVRGAKPTGDVVTFDACDPLILGGGSVPRNLYSPLCRWEFASGQVNGVGCPITRNLYVSGSLCPTHIPIAGSAVTFPSASTVAISTGDGDPWAFLVPQDGPMMGMRFQVGNMIDAGTTFDFADRLPWTWSCTNAHVELSCSKSYKQDGTTRNWLAAPSCAKWGVRYAAIGHSADALQKNFGGQPDMPQPESA